MKENKIYILDKYFEIYHDNRGKFVNVPYNIIIQLKKQKEKILHNDYGGLKAKLTFREKIILTDDLNSLLKYFDKINLDNGLKLKWPKEQQLVYPDDWSIIYRYLKLLLLPTLAKKSSQNAGFLSLMKTDQDAYQFYLEKDFFYAIETSLTSLEDIFSKEIIAWNEREKNDLEFIHHKLNNLSEEMEI